MDHSTSRLYIGAVNHLYDISPEGLEIREHAITGPKPDSIFCAGILTTYNFYNFLIFMCNKIKRYFGYFFMFLKERLLKLLNPCESRNCFSIHSNRIIQRFKFE